ncbi:MAG: AraC family transcriptional regulator [Gammaproteobacteria bacterium]|nr:AraC family transcriptional regulator [Gammaproteobacteria bacterium]
MEVPPFNSSAPTPGVDRVIFDSAQGQWSHSSSAAPAALKDIVIQFWEAHGFVDYSREKILPQGTIELIVNLGPPHQTLDGGDLSAIGTFHSAWISGLHERALIAAPTYDTVKYGTLLVGASLTASGAYALLGLSGRPLTNTVVELSELFTRTEIELLREKLYEAADTAGRFQAFARALLKRRDALGREVSTCVSWSLATMENADGSIRVEDLAYMCGVSRKHLAVRFQDEIGLSPKRYARTLRFAALVRRLENCKTPNWSELALTCGYYDQAHLAREFRMFSGETPTEFMRARSPDCKTIIYD